MTDLSDLPQSVRDEIEGGATPEQATLDALGATLAGKRREAVAFRKESGIEEIWRRAEEAYLGMDEANRHEFAGAKWAKPTSLEGPVQTNANSKTLQEGARSTVFVRLTARYVDAGAAKVCEILLPPDGKSFSIKATPVPDLVQMADSQEPVMLAGQPAERDARPDELAALQAQGQYQPGRAVPGMPLTRGDLAKEQIAKADKAAEKAETRIFDWMVEGRWRMQNRKVVFDAARLGVGVLKAPFPDEKRSTALRKTPDGVELQILRKIQPSCAWVDPWNVYPDPACGEDIQSGDFVFECDGISERSLRKLRNLPGYLAEQIDAVIEEGPDRCNIDDSGRPTERKNRHQFTIWYFHGALTREEALAARAPGATDVTGPTVYAIVTMVNDRVIRATFNPLEKTGRHPYHAMPWRRRTGFWAGVGIGEQMNTAQRVTNASTRAMLNNAGITAGGQIVFDRGSIVPADGNYLIYPNKVWYGNPDSTIDDVNKAFAVFNFPNATAQLMSIIELGFRLAEESTNIPLISQGQSGPTTPDTYGAAQLQNNNANQLLRDIGYTYDDMITEPVVDSFYEWLLVDPDVPDDEKGDFDIDAHGSIALVEKAIQDQTILQLGAMVMNPAFGMSPTRWIEQMLKAKRLNPTDFEMTEEEKQAQANKPPPEAPAVTAAKVRAQSAEKIAQGNQAVAQARAQADIDRDAEFVKAETERTQNEHQARMAELGLKRDLAMLDYANKREITLAEVKADLAKEAAKIDLQRELAGKEQVMKPPTEPAGRAPNGEAFQK